MAITGMILVKFSWPGYTHGDKTLNIKVCLFRIFHYPFTPNTTPSYSNASEWILWRKWDDKGRATIILVKKFSNQNYTNFSLPFKPFNIHNQTGHKWLPPRFKDPKNTTLHIPLLVTTKKSYFSHISIVHSNPKNK